MSHGPMPAAIYWRRRLMVLAAVLFLVWVALRLVGGDDAPTAEPDTAVAPAPQPSVVPTNGAFDVALAPSTRACDPQRVRVTPTVPPGQAAGGPVTINLVMSSTETAPCTLQPADADVLAVISANGVPLWDSTVCSTSLMSKPVQFAGGGWATVVATTWSGRVSGGKCADSESFVAAGRYSVQIGTLGGEPGKVTFELK